MEENKVSMFLAANSECFNPVQLPLIKDRLEKMSESQFLTIQSIPFKKPTTMLIISILVGGFGIDRFMLGDTGMGILKLLTCGCGGILTIIDWFKVGDKTRDYNYQKFMTSVQ